MVNAQIQDAFTRDSDFNQFDLPLNHYFVNNEVLKSVVLDDQKIMIITKNKIIRLNNNLLDVSFNTGIGFEATSGDEVFIKDFVIQPDGKILVLGSFNKYNSVNVKNIVRLNADGSLDTSFNFQLYLYNVPTKGEIYLNPDGKISLVAQTSSGNIFKRLNVNGTVDNTFNPNQSIIYGKVCVLSNGKYIVAHSDNLGYVKLLSRLNLDGTLDTTFLTITFSTASGIYNPIFNIKATNQFIYVGGRFTGAGGNSSRNFIRLFLDGTVDSSFNIGFAGFYTQSSVSSVVNDFVIQQDGKIVVVGAFNLHNGNVVDNILRLNNDGSIDSAFNENVNYNSLGIIKSISFFSDEKMLISGSQNYYFNYKRKYSVFLAIVNQDGTRQTNFNNITKGFYDYSVYDILEDNNNDLYLCGTFHLYNGELKRLFIKLNNDGSIDNSMNYGNDEGFDGYGNQSLNLISFNKSKNKIYLSGYISNYNDENVKQIVKLNLDGSRDVSFNIYQNGFGTSSYGTSINAILPLDNEFLLVGGNFSGYNDSPNYNLVILNANGQYSVGYDCGYNVKSLVYQNDSKILVGGQGAGTFRGLRRYNATYFLVPDDTFVLDSQITSANVDKILVSFNGKIVVIGDFVVNGINKKILKLNNDGSLDSSFNYDVVNSTTIIDDAEISSDDKIIITTYDSSLFRGKLIRLNSGGSIDYTVSQRDISYNSRIKLLDTGEVLLYNKQVGEESFYDGFPTNGLIKLIGEDYYYVNGKTKYDFNSNGCEISDLNFPNLNLSITNGSTSHSMIANQTGNYNVSVSAGIYTLTPILENPSYFNISPTSISVNFPTQATPFNQDFCVTANGVKSDVEVMVMPTTPARPGFDAEYKIVFKNKGNQIENGSVSLTFDDTVLDYVLSNPVYDSSATNSFTWNYTNLQPFDIREITIIFNVNSPMESPVVNNGDVLNYTASINISNTDDTPSDNIFELNQTVVGSYDPNDKTCLQGEIVAPSMIGEYVHYVIRFENTGTAVAQNIVVKDMIDLTKFEISTLVPLKGSHDYYTRINDNKVEFIFENINLDYNDATNDGYVAFKIKTKPTLVVGNTFSNNANIYFDYNFPITTNTYTTTIQALSNQDFTFENEFVFYPNPVREVLNIQSKNNLEVQSVEIYNVLGQVVLAIIDTTKTIDVSNLETGTYFIKINTDKGSTVTKFLKV